MAAQGARLLFVPTNNALLAARASLSLVKEARATDIARATENSVGVIRADVAGASGELMSYGSSGIVDPTGRVVQEAALQCPDLTIADIVFMGDCGGKASGGSARMSSMIRLIGPGGSGKSTTGALLALRLGVSFVDLDRYFDERVGDISEFIEEHGYHNYAEQNIENYCSLLDRENRPGVMALSSGFMTYVWNAHPQYAQVRAEVELCPKTFALLLSLDREVCVSETVRRQIARPFGRSALREEAVIRTRFDVYMAMPVRKVETMRPVSAVVDELIDALTREIHVISTANDVMPFPKNQQPTNNGIV